VGLEEAKQRGEEFHVSRAGTELVGPDSGQVEEALRPTLIAERCRQGGEGKSDGIVWV
jgi:hypothetical protein